MAMLLCTETDQKGIRLLNPNYNRCTEQPVRRLENSF